MARPFPQDIVRRKRDGYALSDGDIRFMIEGLTDGTISDGQIAAFAMAVYFVGMKPGETAALTRAMADSGRSLSWKLPGPVIDKHSTGGVGDKVSLMLAPIAAACGLFVPMLSGRALGHTGGTLDKMDSIPGYASQPDIALFRKTVSGVGCAIIGQTGDIAPADRRLYALRDVTATVESVPLITASILSKKLAAGSDGLVMDVKVGSGAFLPSIAEAKGLASSIVSVARAAGLNSRALITDMNQVLGDTAGNALEVREAIDYLTGKRREPRLDTVTQTLAVEMLKLGGIVDPAAKVKRALDSGAAAERFARMVRALGGPADLVERPDRHLPKAPVVRPAKLGRGVVTQMDVAAVGRVVLALGGGRRLPTDGIDHAVGLSEVAGLGEAIGTTRPFCLIHARSEQDAAQAEAALKSAVRIGKAAPRSRPPVVSRR
ncbi:MAG: thymidine phosphorylase [Alphaproteobacteria bacterium]|nr:thymidine phosphorylase [Alphaproteobacteria bacterium]